MGYPTNIRWTDQSDFGIINAITGTKPLRRRL
jgi:hypothetical protein